MTKRHGSRADREAELGVYELPAFAAGMAIGHLETVLELLAAQCVSHGHTPFVDLATKEVQAAIDEARRWQTMAAMMTHYPFARKETR